MHCRLCVLPPKCIATCRHAIPPTHCHQLAVGLPLLDLGGNATGTAWGSNALGAIAFKGMLPHVFPMVCHPNAMPPQWHVTSLQCHPIPSQFHAIPVLCCPMSSQWHAAPMACHSRATLIPCRPMPPQFHAATSPLAHPSILYHSLPLILVLNPIHCPSAHPLQCAINIPLILVLIS